MTKATDSEKVMAKTIKITLVNAILDIPDEAILRVADAITSAGEKSHEFMARYLAESLKMEDEEE